MSGSPTKPVKVTAPPTSLEPKFGGEVIAQLGEPFGGPTVIVTLSLPVFPTRSVAVKVIAWFPSESVLKSRTIPLASGLPSKGSAPSSELSQLPTSSTGRSSISLICPSKVISWSL